MKYIAGTAPDGTKIRESANTTSWERARKILLRKFAEHDPTNKPLFELANERAAEQKDELPQRKTLADAIKQFIDTKRGENVVDVAHYTGFFERQLLPWCKEQGIYLLRDLDLEEVTKFRNSLTNRGTVKNRKISRLRSFFQFCRMRRWIDDNPAEFLKPSQEHEPQAEYFTAEEFRTLLDTCYVSHQWERGRDYERRADRLQAFLLFARWTGLAMIDVVRFRRDWLSKDVNGVWRVMLYRQKNGNPVYVAIPNQAAEAVLAVPPMSEAYFFWSGNGRPETAVRGWRRSLEHVYGAAKLERSGKKLRAHTHMLRHTFAVEKLNAGASLEDVSLLLAHHSIKITERHYLKFDQRRQERLTRAAMVDFDQAELPEPPKSTKARVIRMPTTKTFAQHAET
jgi:site-specific recombinase XerD